nr:hypothetical protein [Pandoravirus belohorizontensis]
MAHAVVTLTGTDDFVIESLASDNIMRDDPPGGPPTDDEIIAASGPPRRRRPGEPKPLAPPKPKGRGAKEPLKVLTERLTAYLWARADRLLGHHRPHAVVIEQQSKKALRLSALGAVIHSFVLNYYMGRGEEVPPVFMQSGRQKLRVVFRPLPSSSGSSGGGIAAWCAPPSTDSAPRLVTRFRVPPPAAAAASTTTVVKATRGRAKRTNPVEQEETKAKPRSKAKQRRAEEGAVWRANKKHAVVNFALILAHYPGCRRWKPLFERSKKKDDLADAALHAIFLLKAGGTRLARTKDLDDASLIVLPVRSGADDTADCIGGVATEAQETVERKQSLRRRAVAVAHPTPPRVADARNHARPRETQNGDGDDDDDGIIDLVRYASEGDCAHGLSDAQPTDDDDADLADPSDMDDDGDDDDDDDITDDDDDVEDDDDTIDDDDDDDDFAEPVFKRARGGSSRAATTTRPTAVAFSDDSDQSDTEGEDDDDSTWAVDLGICPPPSAPASPAHARRG